MGMSGTGAVESGRRRRGRRTVMSEINVTPMVDVMLVLLIIFMISAPLLTVGVPIDLPQSQAKSLDQDKEPLAISDARGGGFDERIYVRGDRKVDYGTVMKVMGRISGAGFHRVALVTDVEQGP